MKTKTILSILTAVALALSVTACSTEQGTGQASGETTKETESAGETAQADNGGSAQAASKVLIMPKLVGIPWFNASDVGAMRAGEEIGIEVVYAGPTQPDAAEQVKMIEDYLNQGIDAICIAANDPTALKPVLNTARDMGILVMDWDTPADIEDVDYSVQSVDPTEYGEALWDYMVKAMGAEEGQYAILTGGLEAAALNMWIDAGREYAKEKYPNLELVTEPIATNEQQQEAYSRTLDLIKTYPDLKAIVAVSTPAPIGAAQAVQEKGLQDQIAVVGGVLPNDANQYLKDGSLDYGVVEANPELLGYATAKIAAMALNGEKIEDGALIEGVGNITVYENGKTIVLGPPLIIDANNVDEYDF